jgi:hypothetical protein
LGELKEVIPMQEFVKKCTSRIQWSYLAVGAVLALVGGFMTASVVGSIVGIPLLLLAWPLLSEPRRTVPCA